MTEGDIARLFGLPLEAGTLFEAIAASGMEAEFVLPAGAVVHVGDRPHILLSRVAVRSTAPATLIEGFTAEGTDAHRDWPSGEADPRLAMALRPAETRTRRRVALLGYDVGSFRAAAEARARRLLAAATGEAG